MARLTPSVPLPGLLLLAACQPPGPRSAAQDTAETEETTPASAVAPDDILAIVGEPVTLDAGASTGTTLHWDLGDGSTASGPIIEHTWTAPGRYRVQLSAEGSPPDQDSLVVTAVNPPLEDPPTASGRLVFDGYRLFAALPDFDAVAVMEDGVVARIGVCDRPVSLSAGEGRLAIACRDGVQVYDEDLVLVEEHTGPATAVLLDDGLWILRPDGTLEGPEGSTRALQGQVLVGWQGNVATAAFKSPIDHGLWWDGSEHRLSRDPGPDSDTNARGVPNLLGAGAMRPDGQLLAWGGLKANTERGLYVEGTAFSNDNVVRAELKVVDPATAEERTGPIFDNRDRVGALAFTPMGDALLVAHHGARIVDILDAYTFQRIGGFQDVGHGLDGLWTDGKVAWVLASLDRQLIAYDLSIPNGQVELHRIDLVDEEILAPEVLAGARIFHDAGDERMSRDAYISCASCHPDGGEDGRTWDFTQRGEGLRNTLPIWGMPAGGPFHWSANFDELQDFENDIRLHQQGEGYMAEADWGECSDPLGEPKAGRSAELDALAAYMDHLRAEGPPTPPVEEADDTALVAAGCTTCHAGEAGTDAGWEGDAPILHDIGTLTEASGQRLGGPLTGLRTPPLTGVAGTGPWLHDGSASTLEEAVLAHAGVELDEEQLAAIVAGLHPR